MNKMLMLVLAITLGFSGRLRTTNPVGPGTHRFKRRSHINSRWVFWRRAE